jgi:hypothetical protein
MPGGVCHRDKSLYPIPKTEERAVSIKTNILNLLVFRVNMSFRQDEENVCRKWA